VRKRQRRLDGIDEIVLSLTSSMGLVAASVMLLVGWRRGDRLVPPGRVAGSGHHGERGEHVAGHDLLQFDAVYSRFAAFSCALEYRSW